MIDIFLHGLQSFPEMGFFMGLDRIKRVQAELGEEGEKLFKIESSFSYWKMLVYFFVVIMEVNFTQKSSKGLHPDRERGLAKDMMMACVETESKMG
jgi:hypothetical protein